MFIIKRIMTIYFIYISQSLESLIIGLNIKSQDFGPTVDIEIFTDLYLSNFLFPNYSEILNSWVSIRVVGHFRGLKLVMQLVISQRKKAVVNIDKRSIFGVLTLTCIHIVMSLSL